MDKKYNVGDKCYLEVDITNIDDSEKYPIRATYTEDGNKWAFRVNYETLLTAQEVAKKNNLYASLCDEAIAERMELKAKVVELEDENEKLKRQLADANELLSDAQAQVKELTEADCMRVQEFKPIIEERDRLKGELEQEKKRTQVWKDSAEEHRQTAEELEGDVERYETDIADNEAKIQRLEKENNSLKADILELKAQINAFGPRSSEVDELKKEKKAVEDELEYRRSDIVVLNGKLKTANKENGRMAKRVFRYEAESKQKDLIISMLAARVLELEKGGESNG